MLCPLKGLRLITFSPDSFFCICSSGCCYIATISTKVHFCSQLFLTWSSPAQPQSLRYEVSLCRTRLANYFWCTRAQQRHSLSSANVAHCILRTRADLLRCAPFTSWAAGLLLLHNNNEQPLAEVVHCSSNRNASCGTPAFCNDFVSVDTVDSNLPKKYAERIRIRCDNIWIARDE